MVRKRLAPADIAERLAATSGLTVDQVKTLLHAQAELAYSEADEGFRVPGIGVLIKTDIPERKMVMRFGPKQGQEITIPAKRRLNFRISALATAIILGPPRPIPDLFKPLLPDLKFSSEATELSDASTFIADLGSPFTLARDGTRAAMAIYRLPDLHLPTGRILAADALIGAGEPFTRSVPPGSYPLALAVARLGTDERVALSIVRFTSKRIVKWEIAVPEGQDASKLKEGQIAGYGVDSGTGSFCDASTQQLVAEANETDVGFYDKVVEEMRATRKTTWGRVHIESPNGSLALFSSGYGDGFYTSYFGLDDIGNAAALVTDFGIVKWGAVTR